MGASDSDARECGVDHGNAPPIGGVTSFVSLAPACGQSSLTALLRLSPRDPLRWARAGAPFDLAEKTAPASACRRPTAALAAALRPEANGLCAVKRKNVSAEPAHACRFAENGGLPNRCLRFLLPFCRFAPDLGSRFALPPRIRCGGSLEGGPGYPGPSPSAGAGLAVIGRNRPTRASAPTGLFGGSGKCHATHL